MVEENKKNKKSIFKSKLFYISAIGLLLVVGYFGFREEEEKQFVTEMSYMDGVRQIVSVTGSVESDKKIELGFQKSGKIENINIFEGQRVKKGDILANLENKNEQIEVEKAKADLKIAEANLNLEYAGATREEISISYSDINEAKVNLENSRQKLEDKKLINREKEKKAELEVNNAEIAYENAKVKYDNTLKTGETSEEKKATELLDEYEDARTAVIDTIDIVNNSITLADSFLGFINERENREYEDIYDDAPLDARVDIQNTFKRIRDQIAVIKSSYDSIKANWNNEDETIEDLLQKSGVILQETKHLMDLLYDIMIDADPDNISVQADINNLTDDIVAKQNSLSLEIDSVLAVENAIDLAKLDVTTESLSTSTSVDNAKADLNIAESNLEIAKSNLAELKISNMTEENELERAIAVNEVRLEQAYASHAKLTANPREVDLAALKGQIQRQEANLEQAEKNLSDTQIIAPLDALIVEVNGDEGENVLTSLAEKENSIVLISDNLQIKSNVSETDINKIKIGNKAEITFDAFPPDEVFEGEVLNIDLKETVIQGVIYYEVTIVFDPKDADVKSGMTANLDILTASKDDVIVTSPQAINYEENKTYVYVLENGQKVKKEVEIGLEGEYTVEIISGIKEDEEVILYENGQ